MRLSFQFQTGLAGTTVERAALSLSATMATKLVLSLDADTFGLVDLVVSRGL